MTIAKHHDKFDEKFSFTGSLQGFCVLVKIV